LKKQKVMASLECKRLDGPLHKNALCDT
jgi:hypothetical protein